jgi:hypothetical protein
MNDRTIRNLAQLESSASSARVLNLRAVQLRAGQTDEYIQSPLFQNAALNRSIITKHRLRVNEMDAFPFPRNSATKIILPIEVSDLRMGGQYAFVGQNNFKEILCNTLNTRVQDLRNDLAVLQLLDESPSLDPFLIREQLARQGIKPARCYFEISEADTARMFAFAQKEIEALVRMSVGEDGNVAYAGTLARKLLANSADSDLEPLRLTMQMDRQQFQEGIFCWKAFLYYKWQLGDMLPKLPLVLSQIEKIQPRGNLDDELRIYLANARQNIRKKIILAGQSVKNTIGIYDQSYSRMTKDGKPADFRDFLIDAPELFSQLGERLGAVDHVLSYWRYKFPSGQPPVISPDELMDVFMDFESSLNFPDSPVDNKLILNS